MQTDVTPAVAERLPCQVCQHEVPASEVFMAEAVDYVAYFCGLECFDKWRQSGEAARSNETQ